nr:trypsin-like peptidase domain-containing protein [uncultured Albidiferax sp.]
MARILAVSGVVLAVGLVAGCSGGGGGGDGAVAGGGNTCLSATAKATDVLASGTVSRAESMQAASGAEASGLQPRVLLAVRTSRVALGDVSQARLAAEKPLLAQVGVPRKVGLARDVAATASVAATQAQLQWQATASGGQVAAISISTGQAKAVRLGVLVQSLPAQATLRIYAQGSTTAYTVKAQDVLDTLQRNRDAGDSTDAGRTYWTPVVDGAEATLEIELPASVSTASVAIAIPRLSHLFSPAQADDAIVARAAGSCEVDVACNSSYASESNSVALMLFTGSDGRSYQCSGTLLNDTRGSGIPYFLSANHCVSTQAEASTVQTSWFYRAAACGGAGVNAGAQTLFGGATLLYANANTDTSFMRLLGNPPAGAVFAGWSVNPAALGSAVATLHHPDGDVQKISTGSIDSFQSCTPSSSNALFVNCSPSNQASSNFINAKFTSGATEEGSSGGPLFETVGGSRYLVGQLFGGNSSCSVPNGSNVYGRFDVAYTAALSRWLTAAAGTCP